jgi:hypothetical protein
MTKPSGLTPDDVTRIWIVCRLRTTNDMSLEDFNRMFGVEALNYLAWRNTAERDGIRVDALSGVLSLLVPSDQEGLEMEFASAADPLGEPQADD